MMDDKLGGLISNNSEPKCAQWELKRPPLQDENVQKSLVFYKASQKEWIQL